MTELAGDIWDSLHNPQQRHAMLVHLPIAVSLLAVPMSLLLAVAWGRTASTVRWLMVAVFLFGAAAAWITVSSGESAERSSISRGVVLSDEAGETLHEHEEMAEKVGMFFFSIAVLSALTGLRYWPLRMVFKAATVLAAIAATAWVAGTAHYGGQLVYDHGVGVPYTDNNLPDPVTPETQEKTATQPAAVEAIPEFVPQLVPATPTAKHK